MLGQVWVQGLAAPNAGRVVLNHLRQCLKSAIMHVRAGEGDIAERGHGKFALVTRAARRLGAPGIGRVFVQTVVRKGLALKERPAMTMKAIRAELSAARIVLGGEQLEPALFQVGQLLLALQGPVEFGIEGGNGEQVILEARAIFCGVISGVPNAAANRAG